MTFRADEQAADIQVSAVYDQFFRHARLFPEVLHLCPRCHVSRPGQSIEAHFNEVHRTGLTEAPGHWEAL